MQSNFLPVPFGVRVHIRVGSPVARSEDDATLLAIRAQAEAGLETTNSSIASLDDFDSTLYFLDDREVEYLQGEIKRVESLARRLDDLPVLFELAAEEGRGAWPAWFSLAVLAGATLALIPVTDILTGTVAAVTSTLNWSQVFVGLIIVANAGNVAEGYAAIRLAFTRGGKDPDVADSGLGLALGIASASSIQIATFVAPLIVLYSLSSHIMNLVFDPVELSILGLLAVLFAYIAHDGESHWLEGAQLLALYAMAAIVFFVLSE